MIELGAIITGSFLSSAHCVGMCGGFAIAVGASSKSFRPMLVRQLTYSAGRIFTYAFLGALGGFAGQSLSKQNFAFVTAQQAFSILAGILMILVGLSSLGLLPKRRNGGIGPVGQLWSSLFNQFLNARGKSGYLLAGIATGFLPCGLVYTFLALAVARGNPWEGLLWMTAFGIGTAPAMIAIGCGGRSLGQVGRIRLLRLAAVAMLFMGGASVYRAIPHKDSCCSPSHTVVSDNHVGLTN